MSKNSQNQAADGAKILYLRREDRTPYGTIAWKIEREVPTTNGNTSLAITSAAAWCHDNDAFVKSVGRAKALGRLQSTRFQIRFWVTVPAPVAELKGADWHLLGQQVAEATEATVAVLGR